MVNPQITVIINGTTYSLSADKPQALGNMPEDDRLHLLTLLDVLQQQGGPSRAQAAASPQPPGAAPKDPVAFVAAPADPDAGASAVAVAGPGGRRAAAPTRMGSGDIDTLMATLAAEEQRNRRSGLTRAGVYKLAGVFLLFTVLLVLLS